MERPTSVEELQGILRSEAYLADRGLGTSIFLAISLGRPLLLEGAAGVGKTELAKALAKGTDSELIRLQCYEGIDASQALYEWDYTRQLMFIRTFEADSDDRESVFDEVFGPRFLVERPLLRALRSGDRAVLLIDEIDRADDEFEAFLLEMLSDFQVTVPEIGAIRAKTLPVVILTSNRTRELHDALKRRCLYHWINYPDVNREVEIVKVQAPEVPVALARAVVTAVDRIRRLNLVKPPGIAETIDWAQALTFLGTAQLDPSLISDTLGSVVKDYKDLERVQGALAEVIHGWDVAESHLSELRDD